MGVTVGGSKGKGNGAGDSTTYNNTSITAGGKAEIESGGDTTLKGATLNAAQVTATIGNSGAGNLTIESLQNTDTYSARQQNLSGSLTVGVGAGGSVSASKSKINSNFTSVGVQSGIATGVKDKDGKTIDGGFQVSVAGNTALTGGKITSTDKAETDKLNSFQTGTGSQGGQLTTTDLQNTAAYKASASSITVGTSGGSAGVGNKSGNAQSTTQSGITGVEGSGNQAARTGDAETGLKPLFDKEAVTKDIAAQVQITSQFGSQASKAVGNYAAAQMDDAAKKRILANQLKDKDPERAAELVSQANEIEGKWGDNGTARLGWHTFVGALTGGVGGASGALTGTLSAPMIAAALKEAKIEGPLANVLTGIATTVVGAAAGGTAGAAGAANEVFNNYLTPRENKTRNEAAAACSASNFTNAQACSTATRLNALDDLRDGQIKQAVDACKTSKDPAVCNAVGNGLAQMGERGMQELRQLAAELAPSCAPPRDCTQAANWGSTELSTLYRANQTLWPQLSSGAVEPTMGPVEVVGGGVLTIPRVGLGFVLGSGFDAAGQYAINGTVRIEQSFFAGFTGGVALPLTAGRGVLTGVIGGAGAAGANTNFNNWMYNENTNVWIATGIGGAAGGLGTGIGNWVTNRISYTPNIPITGNIPRIPIVPPFGATYAPQIGNGVSDTIGGIPAFIPLDPNVPVQPRDRK